MRLVEFKASFDRTYKKLTPEDQRRASEAIQELLDGLEAQKIPHGFGLKRLQDDQWEIRAGLSLRIGFRMLKDRIEFGIVGDHETIKRYLKNF